MNYSLIYCFAFNLKVEVNMEVVKLVIMFGENETLAISAYDIIIFVMTLFMMIVYFDNVRKCGVSFFSHYACCCCT